MFLGMTAVEYVLHALPNLATDKRHVFARVSVPLPLNFPHVERIAQHRMDRADRHRRPAFAIDKPDRPRLLGYFLQGQDSGRVSFEQSR